MVTRLLITRILIDGSILTTIVSVVLVLILYINPRIALSDYPADIKAAVPPRTGKELRQGILISIPLLLLCIAIPLYSVWLVKQQSERLLTYWMAFVTLFGEYFIVSIFDLIVLDIGMFYTWTPKFLILPGTESMPGYKDYCPHLKAQLIKGNVILVVFSALLALIPTYLY